MYKIIPKILPNFSCIQCGIKEKEQLKFIGYYGKFQKPIWICKKCDV